LYNSIVVSVNNFVVLPKFMKHSYKIIGMTCNGCVSKAKSELLKIRAITEAHVQLEPPQAAITMQKHIPLETLQAALTKAGNYTITETNSGIHHAMSPESPKETKSWLATYKSILIVFAYITGITLLIEIERGSFIWKLWMQNFMAAFFLIFSLFKMLDLKGFAESYFSYDIIAKRWIIWGYVYAFIELGLGLAYMLKFNPLFTNIATFVVMSISIIGVIQSVLNKRKIKCACLGAVFNLPMSTITILEDALMIGMSGVMILTLV
jgi:copper chaperone CopZ